MIQDSLSAWRKQLYLYATTAANMQPQQVTGMGKRAIKEQLLPRLPVDLERRYETKVPDEWSTRHDLIADNRDLIRSSLSDSTRTVYKDRANSAANGRLTFMNRSLELQTEPSINWYDSRFEELPLLWSLKLYAFEPLEDVILGVDPEQDDALALRRSFDAWIEDWIESVEIGRLRYLRGAWTPWSVSLRIQRWIQYAAWRQQVTATSRPGFEAAFEREIYKNAVFLRNHIEWDVGGNHLVENGIALLVAGLFFDDRESDWTEVGMSILAETGMRQFLDDGCHYERSPMYHVLTLTRVLTASELLSTSEYAVPTAIETAATNGTAFLESIRPPDGRLPLLNDAVYGQSLPLDDCLQYAAASGIRTNLGQQANKGGSLGASGYRWLPTEIGTLLFDGGPLGPKHLPGHSHSDTLSVLLWLGEHPVVTDTGTFGYVSGPRRDYARGVRSHSTVQVGDAEPIEIGGTYLLGSRTDPQLRTQSGEISLIEGRYESTSPFCPAYTHHRAVYGGDDWWLILDTVGGHGRRSVTSRLPLHPDVSPSVDAHSVSSAAAERIRLTIGETDSNGYLYPINATDTTITDGWYFPRFGVATERPVVEIATTTSRQPARIGVLITAADCVGDCSVQYDDGNPQTLLFQESEYQLPPSRLSSVLVTRPDR